MTPPAPVISVVVPVYRAEACLRELYRRLVAALETITPDFEILLVEDCGPDRSWDVVVELCRRDPRVKGLHFTRNFGQHHGITAGLDHCRGAWAVVMDCDLQDPPEAIPALYEKAIAGCDVVVAQRTHRKDPLAKRIGSRLFYRVFSWVSGMNHDHRVANFMIISRKVVRSFCGLREQMRFFPAAILWLGYRQESLELQAGERYAGGSAYTFRKLWRLASGVVIAYSDRPLRLTVGAGFCMSLVALAWGCYFFLRALLVGRPVSGWSSLIVSLYLLGGIIIAVLGMIGIYVGKCFDEAKRRPLYVVAERVNLPEPEGSAPDGRG